VKPLPSQPHSIARGAPWEGVAVVHSGVIWGTQRSGRGPTLERSNTSVNNDFRQVVGEGGVILNITEPTRCHTLPQGPA